MCLCLFMCIAKAAIFSCDLFSIKFLRPYKIQSDREKQKQQQQHRIIAFCVDFYGLPLRYMYMHKIYKYKQNISLV